MSEEAKRREDQHRQAVTKRTEEQIKMLAELKRYAFTAFIGVSAAAFGAKDSVTLYTSVATGVLLLVAFYVLTIIRYRKIKTYADE